MRFYVLDSRLRGNDGIGLSAFHLPPSRKTQKMPSESSVGRLQPTDSINPTFPPFSPNPPLFTIQSYATEPSFPRRRESRPVGTETYRAKRFLEIPHPRFPPARE
ncbi:hypothetical protein EUA30_08275 [Neisseria meningitidis]|nr:hypothetical protein EUA30_08275 [Neisseria meningitidis]